ncbi:hypothetical protein RQM47_04240 [Rubrivirga sp. S365]|uniref:hypothetical protein n=1 Tax=Rubrivirga sp. S365 TaxID=3076080 RepID=UPI0028C7817C|nr:hypothetical protein [Rubrivirga sp. S365]MDT7855844.1 hypothetical protein [Rubrivirga sp. S365]
MKHFVDHIELYLSAAGLVVVWAAAALLGPAGVDVWQIAAVTALGVSVVHGVLFWVVRRRQRLVRARSVHEIREMLADQVKNQLAVMRMWLPEGEQAAVDAINESIDEVAEMVDGLSEERLRAWQSTYANTAHLARPAAA